MNDLTATTKAILPQHVDSTMISCWRSCQTKFYDEFILGLRPAWVSVDLHAGATFAGTLETFYKNFWLKRMKTREALNASLPTFLSLWGDFEIRKETAKTKENMWSALETYIAEWPPDTDLVQPFFREDGSPTFEFSFAIPLDFPGFPSHPDGGPFIYCGRPDLFGTREGTTVIRDEKTTGRLDGKWAQKWDLRSQFVGYCWAATMSGVPCSTVVVRGIVVRKYDILPLEAIKMYAQWEIDRWFEQLRRDLWSLRRAWDEGYFDFNLAESCTMYGGCPFLDLCKSPHPERWHKDFRVSRWNPLHRNPIDPTQELLP